MVACAFAVVRFVGCLLVLVCLLSHSVNKHRPSPPVLNGWVGEGAPSSDRSPHLTRTRLRRGSAGNNGPSVGFSWFSVLCFACLFIYCVACLLGILGILIDTGAT